MNKVMMVVLAAAALLLSACATTDYGYGGTYNNGYHGSGYYGGDYDYYRDGYRRAQVWSSADEGRYFSDGSRVICRNQVVSNRSNDPNRVGGTIAGAVIGGLIGNQIGDGSGRTAATAAGAIAGGAIGRHVQGQHQDATGQRRVQRVCYRVWR